MAEYIVDHVEWEKFEDRVLEGVLSGESPILGHLRDQLRRIKSRIRRVDSAGFKTKFELEGGPPLFGQPSLAISDTIAKMGGLEYGSGFVLFVTKGEIDSFEGYTFGEDWPTLLDLRGISYIATPRKLTF